MSDSFSSKRPRVRKMSSPHHSNLLLSGTNSNATSVMLGGGVATSPFSNKRPRNNIKSRGGGGVTVGGGASHKFGRGLIPSSSASSSPVSATVSLRPFEDEEEELLPRHEIILGSIPPEQLAEETIETTTELTEVPLLIGGGGGSVVTAADLNESASLGRIITLPPSSSVSTSLHHSIVTRGDTSQMLPAFEDDEDDENGLRIKEESPNPGAGVIIGAGNSSPSGGLNLSSAGHLKIEEVGLLDGTEPEKLILVVTGDHSDLLGGSFVTLQGTGPDGESSYFNVPTSSFGQSITDSLGNQHTLAIQDLPANVIQGTSLIQESPSPVGGALSGITTGGGPTTVIPSASLEPSPPQDTPPPLQNTTPDQLVQLEEMGPEPYGDVFTGEVLHVCPADCSYYCRSQEDMSEHLTVKHTISIPANKLSPVVFDSVNNVHLQCSHCSQLCFRDVVITYRGLGSSSNSKKVVKRTVRQCKRCGMESSTKSSMIIFNAHVTKCHSKVNGGPVSPSPPPSESASGSSSASTQCPICGVELTTDLNQHIKTFHSVSKPTTLTTQVPTSSLIQFICTKCGEVFNSHSDLARHQDAFHGERIKYECAKCKFVSDDLRTWNSHFTVCSGGSGATTTGGIGDRLAPGSLQVPIQLPQSPHPQLPSTPLPRQKKSWKKGKLGLTSLHHSSSSGPLQHPHHAQAPSAVAAAAAEALQQQQQQTFLAAAGVGQPQPNPQCPRCDFQTSDIKSWNDHYLNCTLKYAK